MNNERRNNIRWQDGTYDSSRECSSCNSPDCKYPTHPEAYREVITKKSYWDFAEQLASDDHASGDSTHESPLANPDSLTESLDCHTTLTKSLESLRNEAFETLTARQQEIWILCMRQGTTEQDAANQLGIARSTVHTTLTTAKAKYTNFLRENGATL